MLAIWDESGMRCEWAVSTVVLGRRLETRLLGPFFGGGDGGGLLSYPLTGHAVAGLGMKGRTILLKLQASAFKYTASTTRHRRRTRRAPSPCRRFNSEAVASTTRILFVEDMVAPSMIPNNLR